MLKKLRPRKPSPPMAVALLALFVALGGTATATHLAVNGSDVVDESLTGADIKNGEVKGADIASNAITSTKINNGSVISSELGLNAVTSDKVLDGTLTGADVNESTLDEVPSAAQGGIGRSSVNNVYCNPEGPGWIVCAVVTLTLPAPGRVLVIGRAQAKQDEAARPGWGDCMLGSTAGAVTGGVAGISALWANEVEHVPLVGVTGVLPAGTHSFGVNCDEYAGDGVNYYTAVSAVAVSAR